MLTIIIAIAAVAALSLLLRVFSKGRDDEIVLPQGASAPSAAETAREPDVPDDVWQEEDEAAGAVAITSDGLAFVPHGREVRLVVSKKPEQAVGVEPPVWQPTEQLSRGDLIGARVRRGAPDVDPWRLEALGRDRDYRAWAFETEDAARGALAVLEERVVKPPRDPDGEPAPLQAEDFELARVEHERTAEELATMPEDEPPGPDR